MTWAYGSSIGAPLVTRIRPNDISVLQTSCPLSTRPCRMACEIRILNSSTLLGIEGTYAISLINSRLWNHEMLSPVTFEVKKQGRHGRWIFQRNGCKGSFVHVEAEVEACNLVGTEDGASCHRPAVQRGSFPTCSGTQSPGWLLISQRNLVCSSSLRTHFLHLHGCTSELYAEYSSVTFVHFSIHTKDCLIRENKIVQGLDIRTKSPHTFQQKLYLLINKLSWWLY